MDFLEIAFSDNSEYVGYIPIIMRKNDIFRTVKFVKRNELSKYVREELKIYKSCDYYISANGFTGLSRTSPLLSFNNIVIDIDAHDVAPDLKSEADEEIEKLIWNITEKGFIPKPTLIHLTGRGVQMWYHFEQVSAKYYVKYNKLSNGITEAYKAVLSECQCKSVNVDTGATQRPTGLFRMFNSWNTKTKTKTECRYYPTEYTIDGLLEAFSEYIDVEATTSRRRTPIKQAQSNYIALNRGRLNVLQKLSERQTKEGHRNTILYLAYNALLQLYEPDKAEAEVKAMNAKFFKPLKESEVRAIIKSIDGKSKYYSITQQEFMQSLGISESFYKQHSNRKNAERNTKREQKQRRRALIERAILNGERYKDIAERNEVSVRTVNNIAAEMKKQIYTRGVNAS